MPGIINAIDAVGSIAGTASTGKSHAAVTGASVAVDFASVLGSLVTDTAQKLRESEAASIAGMQGRMSTQEVVEKVMAAQRGLETAMEIRNKVVAAYQEVSRMAI